MAVCASALADHLMKNQTLTRTQTRKAFTAFGECFYTCENPKWNIKHNTKILFSCDDAWYFDDTADFLRRTSYICCRHIYHRLDTEWRCYRRLFEQWARYRAKLFRYNFRHGKHLIQFWWVGVVVYGGSVNEWRCKLLMSFTSLTIFTPLLLSRSNHPTEDGKSSLQSSPVHISLDLFPSWFSVQVNSNRGITQTSTRKIMKRAHP